MNVSSLNQRTHPQRSLTLPAVALLGAIVVIARIVQLSQRTFYWDDLIIPAKYSPLSLTGEHSLFQLHDGHLMPGSALIQVGMHHLAPLAWWPVAAIIILLTAVSFAAWVPVVRILAPTNPQAQFLALSAISLSPFLMDAAGWWSAALNAFAWQLAAAGTIYALLTRRYGWAALALLAGLFFTEKAFTIVPLVVALLVIRWLMQRRHPTNHAAVFPVRGLMAMAVVFVAWLALFLYRSATAADKDAPSNAASHLLSGAPEAVRDAIIPGIVGGPWTWSRWSPSKAFADPHSALWILAAIVVCVALAAWVIHAQKSQVPLAAPIIAIVSSACFLVAIFVLLIQARDGVNTSDLILRSMHYYADWWTGTVLLVLSASGSPHHRRVLPAVTIVFIVSALISTATWTLTWRDDYSRDYLAHLRQTVASTDQPLLSQPTPLEVLSPLAHPYNTIESISGSSSSVATSDPQVVDDEGRLVPGAVLPAAHTAQGPDEGCGYRIESGSSAVITIDNPLPFGDWTWEMNAVATSPDMEITITTPNGLEDAQSSQDRATTVPVNQDLGRQWVRVSGGGGMMKIDAHSASPNDHVCIGAGAIGPLVVAQ